MHLICFLIFLLFMNCSWAQKQSLNHTVYNSWKSLKNASLSQEGDVITYEINPHRGDGTLHLIDVNDKQKKSVFPRGKDAACNQNQKAILFSIQPGYDTIRSLQLAEVDESEWVKDSLGIYWLEKDSLVKKANLVDYKVSEEGEFIAYRLFADSVSSKKDKEKKEKKRWRLFKKKKKDDKKEKEESDGNTLFVLNASTEKTIQLKQVVSYDFNKKGNQLSYVTHRKMEDKDNFIFHIYDLKQNIKKTFKVTFSVVNSTQFNTDGNALAFMASNDTSKTVKTYQIYRWKVVNDQPELLVHQERSDLPEGMTPSKNKELSFSEDGTKLFFGLDELPEEEEAEDTLLDSEKAKLDVWHYENDRLQPQQLNEIKRDEKDSYLSVLHLDDNKLVQLENDTLDVSVLDHGNTQYGLAQSNEKYAHTYNWNYPWPRDFYRVDLKTGKTTLLQSKVNYANGLSPNGKYFVAFNSRKNNYYATNLETGEMECMTCKNKDSIIWKSDINGMPFLASPEGSPGYVSPHEILLYSRFDVWKYDFQTEQFTSITNQKGKETDTELRLVRLNHDSTYIDLDEVYIKGVNQKTWSESIFSIVQNEKEVDLKKRYSTNHKIFGLDNSDATNHLIFRQMNVTDYPDLYFTDSAFNNPTKISTTNPQQKEYVWPTVEQVSWTSYNGEKLEGLLYKPDNFDSTKSYPMLVYFYEMYTQRKHNHYIPKPTASIIYPTEYTSAGYVVFIPNIRYETGHPGQSAYNSIMSGTDKILELYPNVDITRMGLQGQSWGGYQTAQLITMTKRYSAAMAGAPVSNMFSAYGGIRWGSGLNRAFQYEHTQSRIGKTIWEAPELYVENSPLFGVPEIETPLLIMHNDGDGAVPWYQGIELFTAMKRLDKPVWMLNYNGEEHNLMQNANRVDLSIRMRQFFDYYLQGKPAPEWLINGVPALEKGENYGLNEYKDKGDTGRH